MEGAEWDAVGQKIIVSDNLSVSLPSVMFKWVHKTEKIESTSFIKIPVYLNGTRARLLFSVKLASEGTPLYVWYQRGVSLFSWNKS
jgi:hypothetical protein